MNTTTQRWLLITSLFLLNSQLVVANDGVEKLTQNPANWATWGGNYAATRYSLLAQINVDNVKKLKPVWWTQSASGLHGHENGLLIDGNTVYLHAPLSNTVYAINQITQHIVWEHPLKQDMPIKCCDKLVRWLVYGKGKLFLQHANNTVLTALDAKKGKLLWQVQSGNPELDVTNTNAPLVTKNNVITGVSTGMFGSRGFLVAYDLKTGKPVWKGYGNGIDKDTLIKPEKTTSWENGKTISIVSKSDSNEPQADYWGLFGGDTTWGLYSYDSQLNLIYYSMASRLPWNPMRAGGTHEWKVSLWARDADTGEVKWIHRLPASSNWNWDFGFDNTNENLLVDQNIQGTLRKTLVHFDHDGFIHIFDRETGALLETKNVPSVHWTTDAVIDDRPPIVAKYSTETKQCNTLNINRETPASYSPQTGLFYISNSTICANQRPNEMDYSRGYFYLGTAINTLPVATNKKDKIDESFSSGRLIAYNSQTAQVAWVKKEPAAIWSGSVVTSGGVIFYGTSEGYLKALNAKTGEELYKFRTPSDVIGNVSTWYYQGKQYVGVLSGIGSYIGGVNMTDDDKTFAALEEKMIEETDPAKKVKWVRELIAFQMLAVHPSYYDYAWSQLGKYKQGGFFTVFALPNNN